MTDWVPVSEAVRVAKEIELENRAAPGDTRIELLARFVLGNANRYVDEVHSGSISKFVTRDGVVARLAGGVFMQLPVQMPGTLGWAPLAEPLAVATALLRATERACELELPHREG